MTLLELQGLNVWLGESHILQGVDLSVPEGGITALLGRNGAGKTTTLKGVLGLVSRKGSVRLAGDEIGGEGTHRIVQRGVGYVPEDREIFSDLTVEENLRLAERSREPRYELVHELFPELLQRARQRAGTLSGGQQQMLALGRALLNENRLLLVDEPTKGLSPLMVGKATEALRRAAQTATVLLVEQNLSVAEQLAENAFVLDGGRVVYAGSVKALLADADLARKHLGVGH